MYGFCYDFFFQEPSPYAYELYEKKKKKNRTELTSIVTSWKSEFLIVLKSRGPSISLPKSVLAAYRKIVSA
jgi:hypothetical protein